MKLKGVCIAQETMMRRGPTEQEKPMPLYSRTGVEVHDVLRTPKHEHHHSTNNELTRQFSREEM